ncbi:hypothetical protein [Paenarthrobacter sp. NPDC057981]|uniref:hypothetical protein n=1 Tax=Paenarthrobacter sp. NPDC057981 TaxID=3346297 RepID=UPI0036DDEFB9
MKNSNQRSAPILSWAMIAAVVALFIWMARNSLLQASPLFVVAAAYAFLLFRVFSVSTRAYLVMHFGTLLIFFSWLSVEDDLGIPAAGSWLLGFAAGAIGSGLSGKGSGAEAVRERERKAKDGGGFTGGIRLALVNAASVAILVGSGLAHLAFQSPTVAVAAVLAGALVCGWALYRFPPSALTRNVLQLIIPAEFLLLMILAGNTGQMALPFVWTYGVLAGILLGGRYWSGPRLGEPRPPFSGQGTKRRKRKPVRKPQRKRQARQQRNRDKAAAR